MTDYQKFINALRKCAKEHENDRTLTGHIIVSDLCRDTANLLEALEQEQFINKPCVSAGACEHDKQKVLNKIKAEIENYKLSRDDFTEDELTEMCEDSVKWGMKIACDIVDKYKAESEDKE